MQVVKYGPKFSCPICNEGFWTDKVFEKHVEQCEPLIEVHPTPRNFVNAARDLAYDVHKNDTDKVGEPYWKHLKGAADGARVLGGSDFAIAAAYLHDSIEDHPNRISEKYLLEVGFPEEVVSIVLAVTKHDNEEQGKYLDRVIKAGPDAMRVKLGDLLHNMRHDRHNSLPEYTQDRLKMKYRPAIARLLMELELIADEDTQAKLATKPKGTATGYSSYTGTSGYATKGENESTYYKGDNLVAGDWISKCKSPIKNKDGYKKDKVLYELEDGTMISTDPTKHYRIWTKYIWEGKVKREPGWSPAQEEPLPMPTKPAPDKVLTTKENTNAHDDKGSQHS